MLKISMIGTSGMHWPVNYEGKFSGLTLSEGGVQGLLDSPVETQWIEDTEGGAVYGGIRYLPRDMTLGFYLDDEAGGESEIGRLESDFRMDFTAEPDEWDDDFQHTQVLVESEMSGERRLTVQMREAPELKTERDPYTQQFYDITYEMRAPMPLWDSGTHVEPFERSTTSGSGTILVWNPTDVPMRHTWVLTRAKWTLPDPSWRGKKGSRAPAGPYASRTLPLPIITSSDQGVRITRERRKLVAMTFTGSNFQGRMGGKFLMHDIPPYTPPTLLPISYTDAPAGGARAELHQPRLWTRPVGLEFPGLS
ncbi:minor tail protein [Gordonia phage Asapag]|uniref:Minor tail protein n=2 Tax=Getalongvirus TaxID=2733156 RepID=A0A410TDS9_9CAUD|nr:minor tail protein [Gordonia phage BENtherdunthat]YP_009819064.1 minor tail protein [Gordonia phage Asapag]ATW60789.1 minor tail protein [Gordonia phage BENtherdunthat]QAU07170.1 minor tail protein [Gordonia phage Asapag]